MYKLIFLLFPTFVFGQSSLNIELLDQWRVDTLTASSHNVPYNDCWGYIQNNNEYALVGSTEGIHAFKIVNDKFEFVDFVEGKFNSAQVVHRDIKTYLNYAYVVCDEGMSSLQIIDLSYLPDSLHVAKEDSTNFTRVHNLFIDEDNALMYACMVTPSSGGVLLGMKSMQVYSLADPLSPVLIYDGPQDIPEVHDCYVRDNIAYLNCGFDGIRVYDFSNPINPFFLQNMNFYSDQGYNHQGWLSPDGSRYVFGDETKGKKLKNCTVGSNHQVEIKNTFGTNYLEESVPHNITLTNDFAFVAYYNEGFRVYDIRPTVPVEVAHYDTYPMEEPIFKMKGAWGMYSDFPSGKLLVSDRRNGLFLFDFNQDVFGNSPVDEQLDIYPNPVSSGDPLTIRLNEDEFYNLKVKVYDLNGKLIREQYIIDQSYVQLALSLSAGMYVLHVQYFDYLGDEIFIRKRLVVE